MDAVSKPTPTWKALDIYTPMQVATALAKYFETFNEPNPSDAFLRELRLLVDDATVERAKAKVGAEGVNHENTALNLGIVVFAGIKAFYEAKQNEKLLEQLKNAPTDDGRPRATLH